MPTLDPDTEPVPLGIGFALLLGTACSLPIWALVLGLIYWPI